MVDASPQSQQKLQADIANFASSAPPGADVNIQYRYERGPDGTLIVAGATVTITEDVPKQSGLGNRANNTEDIVDIGKPEAGKLTDSEQAYLKRLQAADAAVRSHEALHFRAAGGLGDLPEFQTVTGPDGNQYAVAGSVAVSSTPGANPEQAAREATTLGIAATAPGDASAADFNAAKKFHQHGVTAAGAGEETSASESKDETPPTKPGDLVNLIA